MRLVIALGGNALLRRGEAAEADIQKGHIDEAARALASVARAHEIVLTHGNGPQIGLLALEAENYPYVKPYPLDVLGAESQGMIGYLLQNSLEKESETPLTTTILTRVEVDAEDPAFQHPTKPVGPVYDEVRAHALADDRGWDIAPDGDAWRRVVPSPEPMAIVDLAPIKLLITSGAIVIAAGGGGIPVIRSGSTLTGVEGVIDKDLTASLLARDLHADMLTILTDVDGVADGWGTPGQRFIKRISTAAARNLDLPNGSMGPKVEACIRFVEATGRRAAIGAIDNLQAIVKGRSGTEIVAGPVPTTYYARSDPTRAGLKRSA